MDVVALGPILSIALELWLVAMIGVVTMKLVLHRRWLKSLLHEQADALFGPRFLADRLQLLIASGAGVGWYSLDVIRTMYGAGHPLTAMPQVSPSLLTILAASQSVYLAVKAARRSAP